MCAYRDERFFEMENQDDQKGDEQAAVRENPERVRPRVNVRPDDRVEQPKHERQADSEDYLRGAALLGED